MVFILVPCVCHVFPYISKYIAYKNGKLLVVCILAIHILPQNRTAAKTANWNEQRAKDEGTILCIKIIFIFPIIISFVFRSICTVHGFYSSVLFLLRCTTTHQPKILTVVLCLLSCVYESASE